MESFTMASRSTEDEQKEAKKWCNQILTAGGHGDVLVTELGSDLANGTLLIKILQVAMGVSISQYYATPIMKAQKLHNIQVCLNKMYDQNIPVNNIHADAVHAGDMRAILGMCRALRTYHERDNKASEDASKYGDSEDTPTSGRGDNQDLLKWVESVIHQDVENYDKLCDGHILCSLLGATNPGAISAMELQGAACATDRLKLVDSALREYMVMPSTFDPEQVASGGQYRQLVEVLRKWKKEFNKKSERRTARKRKTTDERSSPRTRRRRPPQDLYLQGASSFTNLTSRREEHGNMVRGAGTTSRGAVTTGPWKTSSTDDFNSGLGGSQSSLGAGQTGFGFIGGGLDRVHSMESGIAYQHHNPGGNHGNGPPPAMARAASHSALQQSMRPFSGSVENIRTSVHSLQPRKRAPSMMRLDSTASDIVTQQMNVLEEKVELLARQFLYERQDMFKQIMRSLIKERRKRQSAEKRLEALERRSKDLVRHYDDCMIKLAKEMEELRCDVRLLRSGDTEVGGASLTLSRELQQLQAKVASLSESGSCEHHMMQKDSISPPHPRQLSPSSRFNPSHRRSSTVFFRTRGGTSASREELESNLRTSYSTGSAASFKKLRKFFGEEPPRVETMETFLEGLGASYTALIPIFHEHRIGLSELHCLSDEHMQSLGISLGQRVRLTEELKKLVPYKT